MKHFKNGSKVGITACSNGFDREFEPKLANLCDRLQSVGLVPVVGACIYKKNGMTGGTGKERAQELMYFFESDDIDGIFDISGGNAANEVLEWLDYETIKKNPKPMSGYSDLTCVLNAITEKTGVPTCLYQIRNLMYSYGKMQQQWVYKSFVEGKKDLFTFPVTWIQGSFMKGVAVGGNLRCLLKLAGTPFFPKMKDKILVLESYSGKPDTLRPLLIQLKHMGVFTQISGILLGTFTEMEENGYQPAIKTLVTEVIDNPELPIARTEWIGHSVTAKGIIIGEEMTFC